MKTINWMWILNTFAGACMVYAIKSSALDLRTWWAMDLQMTRTLRIELNGIFSLRLSPSPSRFRFFFCCFVFVQSFDLSHTRRNITANFNSNIFQFDNGHDVFEKLIAIHNRTYYYTHSSYISFYYCFHREARVCVCKPKDVGQRQYQN